MKYPYYSPNIRIIDLCKAFFISRKKAEKNIKAYFSALTGKEYIIITNSCRTALYLAYKATGINEKEVITSPLTCKVAIDPIVESDNDPVYADINPGDLNINVKDIEHRITGRTAAMQVIHLGGNACSMEEIENIAAKHDLLIIEDCAQSLGAFYKNRHTGSFGDIACFTLIKNAYGIGGGIFATNEAEFYQKAITYNKSFKQNSLKLLLFRIIRSMLETYRKWRIAEFLFEFLLKLKGNRKSYNTIKSQLRRVSSAELKVSAIQIKRIPILHQERKRIGKTYYHKLSELNLLINNKYDTDNASFTKFFLYHPNVNTKTAIASLSNKGIEVMHLEQRHSRPYQQKIVEEKIAIEQRLKGYLTCHDHIISLPMNEKISNREVGQIIEMLRQ